MSINRNAVDLLLQVPMKEQPLLECTQEPHAAFRKLAEQDRDVMEKGVKAFVSFVRCYKEHQCRFIFRLADLDLGQSGTALGLLRLPKMPEMRKSKQGTREFVPSPIDPNDVKVGRVSGRHFEECSEKAICMRLLVQNQLESCFIMFKAFSPLLEFSDNWTLSLSAFRDFEFAAAIHHLLRGSLASCREHLEMYFAS